MNSPNKLRNLSYLLSTGLLRIVLPGIVLPGIVGCGTLDYDLASVPIPVSAKPAEPADGPVQPLLLTAKNILWVHGLFGHTAPDVAERVTDASRGYERIANFRVRTGPGFHDWLVTHLTLSLIRMKTVVISGDLVGVPPPDDDPHPVGAHEDAP